MQFVRGDGYAVYMVTKASPLTISLLDFGDCWTIEDALIRGINKRDVLEHKRRNAALPRHLLPVQWSSVACSMPPGPRG